MASRVTLPTWIGGMALLFAAALTAHRTKADEPPPRPHVILIVADDLGWNDIGYHNPDMQTPHLDRLASGGVRLSRFYVYPTCSPTRICLLAGRNPSHYGVRGAIGGQSEQHLPLGTMTLAAALRAAGYATHQVGKWHLGLRPEVGPTRYGFETSYGYLHGQVDPYTHRYKFGDRTWHRNDRFLDEEGHATDLLTREAVRIIERPHDRPFFLYVAYSVPHFPLDEPAEWVQRYADKFDDPWRRMAAASISHMDDGIGQIVAALDRTGLRHNTLVIFVSDNGGQQNWTGAEVQNQYEGRYQPHTQLGDNRPLRGWKSQLYEGGIRVPALLSWPGHLAAGQVENAVLHALDIMPTVCGLAGVRPPDAWKLEGRDVWPVVAEGAELGPRTFYWRTGNEQAVRVGDWKLIVGRPGQAARLFHLADDPEEKRDRFADLPAQAAELQQALQRSSREFESSGEQQEIAPEKP